MARLARLGGLAALALAVLALPAYLVVASGAQTLQAFLPLDEALVPVNQFEYSEDQTGKAEDILAIYGTPVGEPEAYLFVDDARIVRPEEDRSLAWVASTPGNEPIKLELVRAFVLRAALAGAAAGFGLLALAWFLARRRARPTVGEPAAA